MRGAATASSPSALTSVDHSQALHRARGTPRSAARRRIEASTSTAASACSPAPRT